MADSIHLQIVTSTGTPLETSVKQLYIPTYRGKTGVLEDHKPYIALLERGEVSYTDTMNRNAYLFIGEGFIEVNDNKVVIITDSVEKGEALDKEGIEKKLAEIEDRIHALTQKDEMSPDQLIAAPGELEKAVAEQKELTIKRQIIHKMRKMGKEK